MAEFQRMSDFSEIQDVNIEVVNSSRNDPNDPSDHYGGDSTQINQQGQFNPNYFSLNPLDWARDIKKEIQEFTWAMTPEKKVVSIPIPFPPSPQKKIPFFFSFLIFFQK